MNLRRSLAFATLLSLLGNLGYSATSQTAQEKYDALVEAGIFEGFPDGQAHLDVNMTRSQSDKIVALILGQQQDNTTRTTYTDLNDTEWAAGFIGAASGPGIDNRGNGIFDPNAPVTIEELAKIMVRTLDIQTYDHATVEGASDWAQAYAAAAIKMRPESSGTFIHSQGGKSSLLAATSGEIRYTARDGSVIILKAGDGVILNEDGSVVDTSTLQELIALEAQYGNAAAPGSLTSSLNTLLSQVAAKVAAGELGGNGPTVLANVVETLTKANPSAATSYFDIAINAVAGSTVLTSEQKKDAAMLVSQKVLASVPLSRFGQTRAHVYNTLAQKRNALGLANQDITRAVQLPTRASNTQSRTDLPAAGGDNTDITISPSS